MSTMLKPIIFALLLINAACASSKVMPAQQSTTAANLKFTVPSGWTEEKPSSGMRVGQYKLPKVEGDQEDASVVLYFFGQGQGGSTAANIERWINQIRQPDGSSSTDKAKQESLTVNGLKITAVSVDGNYTAEMAPGSGDFHNNPNYRLRAAVIETPKGSYYLKAVGPDKTMEKWDKSLTEYISSFKFE